MLVCYIRKYVIILGDIPVDVPPTKILGVSPASPVGLTPVRVPPDRLLSRDDTIRYETPF